MTCAEVTALLDEPIGLDGPVDGIQRLAIYRAERTGEDYLTALAVVLALQGE